MQVQNQIESDVRREVARLKGRGRGEQVCCWCPLCEADVLAMAMTILPPRYCTDNCQEDSRQGEVPAVVKNAVFSAVRKVSHRPKHRFAGPEVRSDKVRIVNFNYDEGVSQVSHLMSSTGAPCSCRKCCADVLAYALNRYPPKYGVLHGGTTSLPSYQLEYIRSELTLIIQHAAGVVASRPWHDAISN